MQLLFGGDRFPWDTGCGFVRLPRFICFHYHSLFDTLSWTHFKRWSKQKNKRRLDDTNGGLIHPSNLWIALYQSGMHPPRINMENDDDWKSWLLTKGLYRKTTQFSNVNIFVVVIQRLVVGLVEIPIFFSTSQSVACKPLRPHETPHQWNGSHLQVEILGGWRPPPPRRMSVNTRIIICTFLVDYPWTFICHSCWVGGRSNLHFSSRY